MRVGVDVGGTNTDAVLMDGDRVLAQAKHLTTPDITSGILAALEDVLGQRPANASIAAVMLGTTHFTNALLERRDLAPTAVLRLALPATKLLPPLVDWPPPLREAIGNFTYMVKGGHEFDGREISPLDTSEVRAAARDMARKGVRAVALCGVFSPVNPAHELEAAALIKDEYPELQVTLSHGNGRIGILERENAAVLNSMRGASFLSGVRDGIVVDLGGSSTDVGALVRGFPREASVAVSIVGVRTNFRMPDVLSIALGGGSVVSLDPVGFGSESVGYRITEEALVFGGNTLTATDLAVAGGLARVGNPDLVSHLEGALVEQALEQVQRRVADAVDLVKLSAAPVPVVLVGGGSILIKDSLEGAERVIRPENADVANAIGAAIAPVGGQVEKVVSLESVGRAEAMAAARSEAISKAVEAGADPTQVEIVELV